MICVVSARHKMVCVSKMRSCATQRAPASRGQGRKLPQIVSPQQPSRFFGRGLANAR